MIKKIKNKTLSDIVVGGMKLSPNETRLINPGKNDALANDEEFLALVSSGDISLDNGTRELSVSESIVLANTVSCAKKIYLDNETLLWDIPEDTLQDALVFLRHHSLPAFHQEESNSHEGSTGSKTYQERLRMTTPILPPGKYRVGWDYVWRSSSRDRNFKARVIADDTYTLTEIAEEIKDTGSDIRMSSGGHGYVTFSESASHAIHMDYCHENGTAYVFSSRLEIWRVI